MFGNFTSEFNGFLGQHETLLWTGKPKQGVMLSKIDIFLIPFSLLWGGFAFFWEFSVVTLDAPLLFKFLGIPFVLVGLYLIIGRFFYDASRRKNTFYGITQNRILIKSGVLKKSIKFLNIKTPDNITIFENQDGSGTIVFGQESSFLNMFRGTSWGYSNMRLTLALEKIKNVRKVYQLIMELRAKANKV